MDAGTKENIVRLYESGLTASVVSSRVGVGVNRVRRVLSDSGVKMRSTKDYKNSGWMTRIDTDDQDIVRRYEAGETVSAIARSCGLGFGTIHRRLVAAGAVMRKNSSEKYVHLSDQIVHLYESDKLSCKMVARLLGVNSATVLRYLRARGVEVRPDSSVPVYDYSSPCAGNISVRGTWELCYAKVLDFWFQEGKIIKWEYEAEKIDTSIYGVGSHYIPDFKITPKKGVVSFHEVKGYLRDFGRKKLDAVRVSGVHVILIKGNILQSLCDHYGIPIDTKGAN